MLPRASPSPTRPSSARAVRSQATAGVPVVGAAHGEIGQCRVRPPLPHVEQPLGQPRGDGRPAGAPIREHLPVTTRERPQHGLAGPGGLSPRYWYCTIPPHTVSRSPALASYAATATSRTDCGRTTAQGDVRPVPKTRSGHPSYSAR